MKKRRPIVTELPLEQAKRMANISGEHSAAAKAIADMQRRRANGEDDVILLLWGQMIVVGPRPQSLTS